MTLSWRCLGDDSVERPPESDTRARKHLSVRRSCHDGADGADDADVFVKRFMTLAGGVCDREAEGGKIRRERGTLR